MGWRGLWPSAKAYDDLLHGRGANSFYDPQQSRFEALRFVALTP